MVGRRRSRRFLDQDLRDGIALGEKWEQRLYERLRWADAVVCLITASYNNSAWCAAEVGIAHRKGVGCCQCGQNSVKCTS